ncbi:MAG: hypothetical protein WDA20_02100 [Desulfuromonadales bacterium]
MKNVIYFLLLCFLPACTSSNLRIVPSFEISDLSDFCRIENGKVLLSANVIIDDDDKMSFFGGIPPQDIIPILVCVSNGTDRIFGLNVNDIIVDKNTSKAEEAIVSNGKGAMASALVLVGGTAAVGLLPGILLASAVEMQASSDATEISIHMKNKKLSSGLIASQQVKSGFLYIDRSKLAESYISGEMSCEILDLNSKEKVTILSEIQEYIEKEKQYLNP